MLRQDRKKTLGPRPDGWTQGLRLFLEGIRGGTGENYLVRNLLSVMLVVQVHRVESPENSIGNP